MSRIGKLPIPVPKDVEVKLDGNSVAVKGKLGSLEWSFDPSIELSHETDNQRIVVKRKGDGKKHRALHGLVRAMVNNMVTGVHKGFKKNLMIVGTGYNAKLAGNELVLQIGFCHPVHLEIPKGVDVRIPNPTRIEVSGADKQMVGQFAANVRRVRPPEVYKGKGIKYDFETIKRKAGKALGERK